MPISQQVLNKISIERLKNIVGLDEIQLDKAPLVALMGANGSGKSTVLHAIVCTYQPPAGSGLFNFRFPDFFLPTTDSKWKGSKFTVTHSYRDGATVVTAQAVTYGKQEDRWTPRYERRPERHTQYVGIRSCVPRIEEERSRTYLELVTANSTHPAVNQILADASYILNRNYTGLSSKTHWSGRSYLGTSIAGLDYSALSMGAGEQRLFELLSAVYRAPNYGLVLVDEIDLLMHEDALNKLLERLDALARQRNLQIIFTTHRESVLRQEDKLCVHHIFQTPGKTLSVSQTTPDALHRLTGQAVRPVEVFVEDDLSYAIVARVVEELGIRRHVTISPVGAAVNVFTVLGGLTLRGSNLTNSLFLLDGDVYVTDPEKAQRIAAVITGNEPGRDAMRTGALARVRQLALPAATNPEQHLHALISGMPGPLTADAQEIRACAQGIVAVMNKHQFVDSVIQRLGHPKGVGMYKMAELASQSPGWAALTADLRQWLVTRQLALHL